MLFAVLFSSAFAAETLVPRRRYRAEFEVRATKNVYPEDFRFQGVKLDYPGVKLVFVPEATGLMEKMPIWHSPTVAPTVRILFM